MKWNLNKYFDKLPEIYSSKKKKKRSNADVTGGRLAEINFSAAHRQKSPTALINRIKVHCAYITLFHTNTILPIKVLKLKLNWQKRWIIGDRLLTVNNDFICTTFTRLFVIFEAHGPHLLPLHWKITIKISFFVPRKTASHWGDVYFWVNRPFSGSAVIWPLHVTPDVQERV